MLDTSTTVIVTGASRGFGRGIAGALIRADALAGDVGLEQPAYLLTAARLRPAA